MVSVIDINFNIEQQERSKSSIGYYYDPSDNTIDCGESNEISDINYNEKYTRSMSSETLQEKRQKLICSERSKSTLPGGGKKRKYIPVKKFVTSNQQNQAYKDKIKEYINKYFHETLMDYIMKSKSDDIDLQYFSRCLDDLDTMKKEYERLTNEKNEAKRDVERLFEKRKRSRTSSETDVESNRQTTTSISSDCSNSAPNSPRRTLKIDTNNTSYDDVNTVKKSPHSIAHPYGSYNIRFQTWNLGGIDPSISVNLWEKFITIWIKNKRTNDDETIKYIIDDLVDEHCYFSSDNDQQKKFIKDKKDSMYRNFQKSKLIVFSLLKFLQNKIENKNRFDYIFYCLQEVNYVMQKLLTSGIKLEENGNFGINKFFTVESDKKKYNIASEYIVSLDSSENYHNLIKLDYKITFSNHSNEFTNAIIYPKDIIKVKELSANIGTQFKNNLYTEWNNYLGQKSYFEIPQFSIIDWKTQLRSNLKTRDYFKQFQNARDPRLHSNVLHGVIFELNDINFLLVNCHHPRLDNKWFEQLIRFNSMFQILDTWTTNNPSVKNKIILTGDFNINFNTKNGRKVYDFLVSREFDQETKNILNSFDVKEELYIKKGKIQNKFVNYNQDKYGKEYKTQQSKNNTKENNILDYIFVSSNILHERKKESRGKEIVVSGSTDSTIPTFISRKLKSFSGKDRYELISDHGVEKLLLCISKETTDESSFALSAPISPRKSSPRKLKLLSYNHTDEIIKKMNDDIEETIKLHWDKCKSNNVYKRAQCYHYLKGCTKGDKCNFAHGEKEQTLVHEIHEFIRFNPKKTVNDFIEYKKAKSNFTRHKSN